MPAAKKLGNEIDPPDKCSQSFGRNLSEAYSSIDRSYARMLFDPIVARARVKLHDRLGSTRYGEIPAGVHAGWEAHLIERLTIASARAVAWQFQIFCTTRAAFTVPSLGNMDQVAIVRDFVRLSEKRLWQLYTEFPLLKHLCETLVCHWVEAAEEFFAHFWADRAMLPIWFGEKYASQTAVAVQVGLSDPHHRGRTVSRVFFEYGSTLIYKPRPLAPEVHYKELLNFVNGLDCPKPLKAAQSADRSTYGWMEDVVTHQCKTMTGVESFYWRAGALLGLIFLADGVDMHRENLIAAGEHPVLIDLETIVHPQNEMDMENHPESHSLLRTGFLPTDARAGSALGHTSALWRKSDLDGCDRDFSHLPATAERHVAASDFIESITGGFDWIGNALLRDRSVASQFADRLRILRNCRRRRILRSSSIYGRILGELVSSRQLRQDMSLRSAVEQISQNFKLPLSEDEIISLGVLDIPYLKQEAAGDALISSHIELSTHEAFRAERQRIIKALAAP